MPDTQATLDETTCFGLFHAALKIVAKTATDESHAPAQAQPLVLDGLLVLVDYYIHWISLRGPALDAADFLWTKSPALTTENYKVRFRYRYRPLETVRTRKSKLWEAAYNKDTGAYSGSVKQTRFWQDTVPLEHNAMRQSIRGATAADKLCIYFKASPLPTVPAGGPDHHGLTRFRHSWAPDAIEAYASRPVADAIKALVDGAPAYSVLSLSCVLLEALRRLCVQERPEDWDLLRTAGCLQLEAWDKGLRSTPFWIDREEWRFAARRLFKKHEFTEMVGRIAKASTRRHEPEPFVRARADAAKKHCNGGDLLALYERLFMAYVHVLQYPRMGSASLLQPGHSEPHPGVDISQLTDQQRDELFRQMEAAAAAESRRSSAANPSHQSSSGSSPTVSRKASAISIRNPFSPGSRSQSPELQRRRHPSRPSFLRAPSSTLLLPRSGGSSQHTSPSPSRRPSLAPPHFVTNMFGRSQQLRDDDYERVTATSDSEDDVGPTDTRPRQRGRQ
ncbi:hypothetical protein JCM11641_005428 [Rhodosporidiobolus odoratus]